MRRTTIRSVLFGDADAAFSASRNVTTYSAITVAAVTCCIVLALELAVAVAPPVEGESAMFLTDLSAALPVGSSPACNERGESGTRKILKPAISGNHSAASGDTKVRIAAGTSPLINRSIAVI